MRKAIDSSLTDKSIETITICITLLPQIIDTWWYDFNIAKMPKMVSLAFIRGETERFAISYTRITGMCAQHETVLLGALKQLLKRELDVRSNAWWQSLGYICFCDLWLILHSYASCWKSFAEAFTAVGLLYALSELIISRSWATF